MTGAPVRAVYGVLESERDTGVLLAPQRSRARRCGGDLAARPVVAEQFNADRLLDLPVTQQHWVSVVVVLNEATGDLPPEPPPCWQGEFIRADASSEFVTGAADAYAVLVLIFRGFAGEVTCMDAADAGSDLPWLQPGPVPPLYPECGPDPTYDGVDGGE